MGKLEAALRSLVERRSGRVVKKALQDVTGRCRDISAELAALRKSFEELRGLVQGEAPVAAKLAEPAESKVRFTKRTPKGVRKRLNLTQGELARLVGVSASAIGAWEAGKSSPRGKNLAKMLALRSATPQEVSDKLGRFAAAGSLNPAQIKRIREKAGLSQIAFAKRIGMSPASVNSWERGRAMPTAKSCSAILELAKAAPAEAEKKAEKPKKAPKVKKVKKAKKAKGPAKKAKAKATLTPRQIRGIRAKAGLSQAKMAAKLGVSANSITNWERGHSSPTGANVTKLLAVK